MNACASSFRKDDGVMEELQKLIVTKITEQLNSTSPNYNLLIDLTGLLKVVSDYLINVRYSE
jgi:hypothetical protein